MKKIYFLLMGLCVAFIANAQTDVEWDAEDMVAQDYTATLVEKGITIYASADKKVTVDTPDNSTTIDGLEFVNRFKFNGSSGWSNDLPTGRVLAYTATGPCAITVYGKTGSSSSDRYLLVTTGKVSKASGDNTSSDYFDLTDPTACDNANLLGYVESKAGEPAVSATINYTGSGATIYFYSADSGFNVYGIKIEYSSDDTPLSVGDIDDNREVVKTEFYDINGSLAGVRFESLPKGLYIKKVSYDNGTFETTKVLKSTY